MKSPRTTAPPPSVDGAIWIPLTKGAFALIDAADADLVVSHSWILDSKGYAASMIDRKLWRLHRWLLRPVGRMQVDHASGNKLDNRRANLRMATHSENMRNCRKHHSGLKGAYPQAGMWRAKICVGKKQVHLGYFATEAEAASAYDAAARRMHGDFARVNEATA